MDVGEFEISCTFDSSLHISIYFSPILHTLCSLYSLLFSIYIFSTSTASVLCLSVSFFLYLNFFHFSSFIFSFLFTYTVLSSFFSLTFPYFLTCFLHPILLSFVIHSVSCIIFLYIFRFLSVVPTLFFFVHFPFYSLYPSYVSSTFSFSLRTYLSCTLCPFLRQCVRTLADHPYLRAIHNSDEQLPANACPVDRTSQQIV